MRPVLPRGQPPAHGVIAFVERTPAQLDATGRVIGIDSRGYFDGQRTASAARRGRRLLVRAIGRRQAGRLTKARRAARKIAEAYWRSQA